MMNVIDNERHSLMAKRMSAKRRTSTLENVFRRASNATDRWLGNNAARKKFLASQNLVGCLVAHWPHHIS
jgi:hypothetical protein